MAGVIRPNFSDAAVEGPEEDEKRQLCGASILD
jgi:hypothetical protein